MDWPALDSEKLCVVTVSMSFPGKLRAMVRLLQPAQQKRRQVSRQVKRQTGRQRCFFFLSSW